MYVFYHIPKTGGTAIFHITANWKTHRRASTHNNHVRIFNTHLEPNDVAYTVIRHPYDRFVSAFYHMVDSCDDKFFYRNAKVSDCEWMQKHKLSMKPFKNDPNEFLNALNEKIHPYHHLANTIFHHFDIFKPQFYWICDKSETHIDKRIKYTLHQENLEYEFKTIIADTLKEKITWPESSESNKRISTSTIHLNDLSKNILHSIYRQDFTHLF